MASGISFDYSVPYELMVGVWTGITTSFLPNGAYQSTVPSRVYMYWKVPGEVLHYEQQELPDLDAMLDKNHPHRAVFKKIVSHDFDLRINGKACTSEKNKENVSCVGAETTPGTYLFHLHFPKFGHYYNNQYFSTANERHIIGPYISNNSHDVGMVVAQTFTRISYEVSEELRNMAEKKRKR
ncbi:MAG: hypothetical protein ABI837_15760 [Acidobacteriota bacterium]